MAPFPGCCRCRLLLRPVDNAVLRLLERYGNVEGLANAWFKAFEEATALRRLRACDAMSRMLERFNKHPEVIIDHSSKSDEELKNGSRQELRRVILGALQSDPEFVSELLAERGFIELRGSAALS